MERACLLWRCVLISCAIAVAGSACTGSTDSEAEVVSRTVGVDSEPDSPSTDETTTTAVATTTTEPLSDDEAAVLEAVRRFFEELPDRPDKTKTPDQYPDVLDEYITDPLLTRIRDSDAEASAAGITEESYPTLYSIEQFDVGPGEARVISCDLSRAATFDPDGDLRVPSASLFSISEVLLTEDNNGRWHVREWFNESQRCDPVSLWPSRTDSELGLANDRYFAEASEQQAAELEARFAEYVAIAGFVDEASEAIAASDEDLSLVATRHELYYLQDFVDVQLADTATNTRLSGWRYQIEAARVSKSAAQLLMCAAPDLQFLAVSDGAVVDSDSRATWTIAFMHLGPDLMWRVEYFWFLGEEECAI